MLARTTDQPSVNHGRDARLRLSHRLSPLLFSRTDTRERACPIVLTRVIVIGSPSLLLCGVAVVVVETAAEPLLPLNSSVGLSFRRDWGDELVVQTLMVSFRVIMNQEFTHGSPQRILTKENHSL